MTKEKFKVGDILIPNGKFKQSLYHKLDDPNFKVKVLNVDTGYAGSIIVTIIEGTTTIVYSEATWREAGDVKGKGSNINVMDKAFKLCNEVKEMYPFY